MLYVANKSFLFFSWIHFFFVESNTGHMLLGNKKWSLTASLLAPMCPTVLLCDHLNMGKFDSIAPGANVSHSFVVSIVFDLSNVFRINYYSVESVLVAISISILYEKTNFLMLSLFFILPQSASVLGCSSVRPSVTKYRRSSVQLGTYSSDWSPHLHTCLCFRVFLETFIYSNFTLRV